MINRFQEFSVSIAALYRHIQKIERAEMVKYGLKGSTAQYLTALRLHREGLTASQLCEVCDKDKAAISRVIAELEEKGLVTREGRIDGTATNRVYRARLVLTPQGEAIADHVLERATVAVEYAGRRLTDENRRVFYESMAILAHDLQIISKEGLPED